MLRVTEADPLAARLAKLACDASHRGLWSMENRGPVVVQVPTFQALLVPKGARLVVGVGVAFADASQTDSRLTNASTVAVLAASRPGSPHHLRHPSFEGHALAPDGRGVG
jgi:hypothetical protein